MLLSKVLSATVLTTGLLSVTVTSAISTQTPFDARLAIPWGPPKPPRLMYTDLIGPLARRIGVDPALVKSIVKAESAFNIDAVSPKGALGLMQVMPATAQEMGLDASDPAQNLEAGTRYLKWLLARYSKTKNGLEKAIAAYNAGPGAVDRHHGVPKYKETRNYVTRVLKYFKAFIATS